MPQPALQCTNAIAGETFVDGRKQLGAAREIDAPPVVRIHEAQVPRLRALIDVGHSRRGQLQRDLHQAIVHAEPRDAARERSELRQKGAGRQRSIDERCNRRLVALVGCGPSRMPLRFADGFRHGAAQPLGEHRERFRVELPCFAELRRPRAEQRLIEVILVVRIGRRVVRWRTSQRSPPARDLLRPLVRQLGQHGEPRTRVLAALRIVRRRRQQRLRPAPRALDIRRVKLLDGAADALRLPADVVQRDEAVVAVERSVLEAFGHHGPAQLLHLHAQRSTANG